MKLKRLFVTVVAFFLVAIIGTTSTNKVQAKSYQSKIVLPKGYTRSALLKAYQGKPSSRFIKASMQGMNSNNFSRTSASESAKDNKTKIKFDKLTASQRKALAKYSLKLINGARKQLGLKPWVYSSGAEKLAADIAKEYSSHGKSIKTNHYTAGIVRACKKNGLNFDDNYVEDMAGFSAKSNVMTMTQAKKNIYFGIKQMIFGYAGSGESGRFNRNNYREWEHAGDLFNTQGGNHDGDYNYFGFSVSRVGKTYTMHFISVPSFAINDSRYNTGFKK